jgi:hypothetical protein
MKQYHITEKAVQETFVSDFPNVALLDAASLRSEVQRLTEELALSNARVSTLEAENKTLKLKLKEKKKAETNYSKHLSKYFKDSPDLYDLCEEMGALTHQSKQSKRVLERSFVGDTICQVGTIPSWTIHHQCRIQMDVQTSSKSKREAEDSRTSSGRPSGDAL